ncbi:MAG: thermonuclease family protein [Solirubrobacterales bacterium]
MEAIRHGGGWLGSVVLLLVGAALILRPWEADVENADGPATATALVTRVVDGDTVEARIDGTVEDVRYIGVDTPETVKPDTPVQCFGPRASAFNHHLVEGKIIHFVFGVERRDIYGRLLGYAYLGDRFVNAELVRRGLARTLEIAPNTRFASRFSRLESDAARAGRGIWGACPP